MPTRPATPFAWCTNNPAGITAPPTSEVETGFAPGQPAEAGVFNSLFNQIAAEISYLDSQSNSVSIASTLDPSMRLISAATFTWKLSTTTLAWSAPIYLSYPGVPDSNNIIAAGSIVIPSGSVAYVQANAPFTTTVATTSGSSTLTNVAYADQIQVGWVATGAGIPSSTTVVSLGSDGTSVRLSNAATATAGSVSVSFAGSGQLSVQAAPVASVSPSANMVLLARATETTCIVGVGTGQMRLHDGEAKILLEDGFSVRRLTAGTALTQNQAVYISKGMADTTSAGASTGRTAGSVYPTDSSGNFTSRSAVVGYAISNQNSGDTAQIAVSGIVNGFSGLTPGASYYLDPANVGGITSIVPSTSTLTALPVGIAVSATSLLINPNASSGGQSLVSSPTISGSLTAGSVSAGGVSSPVISSTGTIVAQQFSASSGMPVPVDMGGLYIPANYSFGSGSSYSAQPLQKFFSNINSASGEAARAYFANFSNRYILGFMLEFSYPPQGNVFIALWQYTTTKTSPFLLVPSALVSVGTVGGGAYIGRVNFTKGTNAPGLQPNDAVYMTYFSTATASADIAMTAYMYLDASQ